MRFLARRTQGVQLDVDDWLVLPALALVIGIAAAILEGAALKSVGYPTPPPKSAELALATSSYQQTITRQVKQLGISLFHGLMACSCMFFYRRVFRAGGTKIFDAMMFSVVAVIVIWTVSFFFALPFGCRLHFDYLWTSLANEAKCVKSLELQNGFAISDVITDFLVLIFPIPLVWKLQMSTARRLGVTSIFLLRALAVAASITQIVVYVQATAAEFSSSHPDEDLLSTAAIYMMMIEVGFGLCAANLPTLYGMARTKGVQTLMNSFQSLFSLHSLPLGDSHGSPQERQRNGSQDSDSRIILNAIEPKQSSSNIEYVPTQHNSGVRVTKNINVANSMV
ncbi:hypothetical protein MMC28_009411 [Mycoblastus sanguinarius]|nr:hypothetical protein [Mycoblastus sanguinarius]